MQGQHRKRPRFTFAFIAALTVVGLLAGILGDLVSAPSATAAGTTPTFRLDGDVTRENYEAFILQMGANVNYTSQDVNNEVQGTALTVNHTNPDDAGYTEAAIVTNEGHTVRLRFRTNDMYFVGWFDRNNRYVYVGPRAEARVPAVGTTHQLTSSSSYGSLESMGNVNRYTMYYGRIPTQNHALSLWNSNDNQRMAAAAVYFAQFISEATRFRSIADQLAWNAFGGNDGESWYTQIQISPRLIDEQTNWGQLSQRFADVQIEGNVDTTETPLTAWILNSRDEIVQQTLQFAYQYASVLFVANGYYGYEKGNPRRRLADRTFIVAPDGTGDYETVQAAIDAVPEDGVQHTIEIDPGTYHEVITVPAGKRHLSIKGMGADAQKVLIHNTRAHGMLKPDGTKWGTEGSAVATFKAPDMTVSNLSITNTFDPAAHPEISPYETQAVAVAAKGDRQVYSNVRIISRQDTLLVKASTPWAQARQYFVNCFIRGTVDFIFGNATAVIDRSDIQMVTWPGGTMLAPNTDYRKKYGILVTDSKVLSTGAPMNSMYLGRPWHNTGEAEPQAVVRNTVVYPHINATQPWTNMVPEYPWQWARFKEYKNSGLGAGTGANAPKLTDAEAADYTAQKYLAGDDGWNPVL